MINQYKNIAIIWGGTFGAQNATRIQRILDDLHIKEGYPVKCKVQLSPAPNQSIIHDVTNLFINCDYVVALLSLTDEGRKKGAEKLEERLRQNVLIELGMAVSKLGIDRIAFMSDFDKKGDHVDGLPSDFDQLYFINISQASDAVLKKIFQRIMEDTLKIKPNRNIYTCETYTIDYKQLFCNFSQFPSSFSSEEMMNYFSAWEKESETFDWPCERYVYMFERIKFLSIFSRKDDTIKFLDNWRSNLKCHLADGMNFEETPMIRAYEDRQLQELLDTVFEYLIYRLTPESRLKRREKYESFAVQFGRLEEEILNIGNPLFKVVMYEYWGLSLFHMNEINHDLTSIDEVIRIFNEGFKYVPSVRTSYDLWGGFYRYDLARAYQIKYGITRNAEDRRVAKEHFNSCVRIRKDWVLIPSPTYFKIALNYEYFKAELHYLQFRAQTDSSSPEMMDEYRDKARDLIVRIEELQVVYERIDSIKNELKNFGECGYVRIDQI